MITNKINYQQPGPTKLGFHETSDDKKRLKGGRKEGKTAAITHQQDATS